ncbi:MAG: bifunctional diguanylate cyclase/phosphodiesterase [Desulfurivibrionaceae bacterium]
MRENLEPPPFSGTVPGRSRPFAGRRLGQRLWQFASDLFGINPDTNIDPQERGKDIRLACGLGFPVVVFFAIFNLVNDYLLLGVMEAASAFIFLPPAYEMSRKERMLLPSEIMVMLCATVIYTVLYHLGGIEGTGIYWIFSMPFIAFFVTGQQRGWLWSLVILSLLLLITPFSGFSSVQLDHFELAMFFYVVIAASFNMLRIRFETKLDRQVKENTVVAQAYLEKLQFLAIHDEHTGLPNREGIIALLAEEMRRDQDGDATLVVVYLKLVRVVELLNIIGPEQGNLLFSQIVKNLKNMVQSNGHAGRLGRDEFVFFFRSHAKLDDGGWLASRLGEGFECMLDSQTFNIEYQAGICAFKGEAKAEDLLRKTEQAMLAARSCQRDFFVYDEDDDRKFIYHHLLFGKLREALQRNHLEMYYQPKVELATGVPIGAEALARWNDSEVGPVSPALFIPVAEQSGLIIPLTRWAITTAVAQCAEWRASGLDLGISINISARNLADPGLISHLENMADTFRVPPERITIELTEGVFLDISKKATTLIHRMHEKGFRVSIDDYGTGYSSLAYIKGLPVSELKIDQCFVRGIMESRSDAMIVRSTIEMARRLGMSVVAEGVEEAGIVAQLHGFGCSVGQGYHFGRPMPGRVFLEWAEATCGEVRGAA